MKKTIVASLLMSSLLLTSELSAKDLVLGLQGSIGSTSETLSNTTGEESYSYTLTSYKLLLGHDFDFYGQGDTSRLAISYKYNILDSDEAYHTYSLGYQENMTYFSFYDKQERSIFPFAGFDMGWSMGGLGYAQNAFNTALDLGLAYRYKNMELTLAYTYNYATWDHTEASDIFYNNQATLGFTYTFKQGDQ